MISVIIPTLNAESRLPPLVDRLRSQTSPPDEIIVIDSSSSDRTVGMAGSLGLRTVQIKREEFDHGRTRNLGAEKAAGDVLVYLTQDALPADGHTIRRLIEPLQHPEVASAYARQVPAADAGPLERFARLFNYPPVSCVRSKADLSRTGIKTFFFSNVCSAYRRKEFEELGGFPRRTIMNEDIVLAARLIMKGYHIAYAAEARVVHSHRYSLVQVFKRYFDIGASFNQQRWMLDLARAESEGCKYLQEQLRFLARGKKTHWIPYACIEAVVKYLAYRLGLNEDMLPVGLKRWMSMHPHFWEG